MTQECILSILRTQHQTLGMTLYFAGLLKYQQLSHQLMKYGLPFPIPTPKVTAGVRELTSKVVLIGIPGKINMKVKSRA